MGAIDKEEIAAETILAVENGASERVALKITSEKYKISAWRIRGTLHLLVFEILRRLNTIDFLIQKSLQKGPIHKLHPLLRNLLRVGTYNLKFTDIPPAKITKLIVEKTKQLFGEPLSKFTNAVLRKIENLNLADYVTDSTDITNLSLKYYHPPWFIKYLINLIGLPETMKFLKRSLESDITYIRINTLKTDLPTVTEKLAEEGYTFEVDRDLSDVIKILTGKYPIIHSSLYKEGAVYLQDKASALVSHVLNPQKEEIIFDLCAAPGGKSMHIGQLMQNKGMILAIDRSYRRLTELSSKLRLYELYNIYIINTNAELISNFIKFKADKILIDPPCSGTGTFISRPNSKWKIKPKNIDMLTAIQWNLLTIAVPLIKSSGEIIYSTCSITLEENEQLIKRFLEEFPEFALMPANPFLGIPGFLGLSETQRLFPHLHDTEGFFIAKLKKTN